MEALNSISVLAFKKNIEKVEQSGQFKFERSTGLTETMILSLQTLMNATKVDDNMRDNWQDSSVVSTKEWLNYLV